MKKLVRVILGAVLCLSLALPAAAAAAGPRAVFQRMYRQYERRHHLDAARAASAAATVQFDFPYALATDGAGNVYVVNSAGNTVDKINGSLGVSSFKLPTALNQPFSVTVDPEKNVYVGQPGEVQEYTSSRSFVQTFTANAGYPLGIVADEFGDLFLTNSVDTGVAVDDPNGDSLYTSIFTAQSRLFSLTIGGPYVYTFYDGNVILGNGSDALLRGDLAGGTPLPTQEPIGSACTTGFLCWFDDAASDTLIVENLSTHAGTQSELGYAPAGVAYDSVHNRLFVADPENNAVHVYNPTTLALIKTIT